MIRAAGAVLRDGGHVVLCVASRAQERDIKELLHDAGFDAFRGQFEILVFTGREYDRLRGRSGTIFIDHLALEGAQLGQLAKLYRVASPGWDIVVDAGEEGW